MEIQIWLFILIIVLVLIAGLVGGFLLARVWFKKYLEKNPPMTETMVREMMSQMGRKPSERQVRQVMATMNPSKDDSKKKKKK